MLGKSVFSLNVFTCVQTYRASIRKAQANPFGARGRPGVNARGPLSPQKMAGQTAWERRPSLPASFGLSVIADSHTGKDGRRSQAVFPILAPRFSFFKSVAMRYECPLENLRSFGEWDLLILKCSINPIHCVRPQDEKCLNVFAMWRCGGFDAQRAAQSNLMLARVVYVLHETEGRRDSSVTFPV
jgi:hypothetical protein